MAAGDREVNLRITADDQASKVIDDVASELETLEDGAEVEVTADTGDALSNIERFAREVDDLTDEAREVRVEFKKATLERDVKAALRDLERLEDPIDIETRTADLQTALDDLKDLDRLASEKYQIDLDVDPARTARAAADDLDSIRQRGEGLQSAIPAIRGFGDELGGISQQAGIASQAVADLGDFALIAGERFAAEGSRMAGVATKLGTALGSIGLAGAIAGIAVQLGSILLPKLTEWLGITDKAAKANEDLATSVESAAAALAKRDYEEAVRAIVESNDELIGQGRELGVATRDIVRYLLGLDDALVLDHADTAAAGFENFVGTVKDARGDLEGAVNQIGVIDRLAAELAPSLLEADSATLSAAESLKAYGELMGITADETDDAADAATDFGTDVGQAMSAAQRAVQGFRDRLDMRANWRALRDASATAMAAVMDHLAGGETSADDAAAAVDAYRLEVLDVLETLKDVPPEKVTEIMALIDKGSYDEANRAIAALTVPRSVRINIDYRQAQGADQDIGLLGQSAMAASPTNVTVNMPRAADARDVTGALDRWARTNG